MTVYALLLVLTSLSSVFGNGIVPGQIKNLVTFGDSYTDVVQIGDGGTAWPVYAAGYANITLFPFAKSGATCSNNITSRPFPSVFEAQLPAYFTQTGANPTTHAPGKLNASQTLYTLWIGTNDIGANALLTGSDGTSNLVEVTQCMVNWVSTLYESGARNFLFQNMIPLELTVLYSPSSYPNGFWKAQRNTTEWSLFMNEMVLSANSLTKLMLQALAPTLPGAHIGIFDSHALFTDMYNHPQLYLNGTAPLNVTNPVNACVCQLNGTTCTCTTVTGTDRDSYLWWDELHPSEQADRIVAREVALVAEGKTSQWNTWLS